MEQSVKVFWIGAVICLAGAIGLSAFGMIWYSLAFLLVALTLCAAAVVHTRECAQRRRRLEEYEKQLRDEADAVQAEKAAAVKRCGEDIARFHSVISHGLRVPISIVVGYADLLKGGMVTDEAVREEYLQKICAKVIYMNELLGQMLLELRTETNMAPAIKEPVEILSLLGKIADDIKPAAGRRGISVRVVSEAPAIFVMGNVIGLTKAFYNILENSLKYMSSAGSINITASKTGADEALIVFKDDGVGLSAEETEHIFELNYRGSNSVTGNGLGLYLVKTEIAAHGGSTYAKSDRGRGMGIYVTIPTVEAPQTCAPACPQLDNERVAAGV